MSATAFELAHSDASAMPALGKRALMVALSLCLAGCSALQQLSNSLTPAPPLAGTNNVQEVVSAAKPAEKPPRPAGSAPQPLGHAGEIRPAPEFSAATPKKGAEKLASPKAAEVARATNKPTPAVTVPKTAIKANPEVATTPAVTAHPVVKELIFKGPERKDPPPRSAWKVLLWVLLVLGGAAGAAGVAWFRAKRRPGLAGIFPAPKKDEVKVPGLLFKEPLGGESSGQPALYSRERLPRVPEVAMEEEPDFLLKLAPEMEETPEPLGTRLPRAFQRLLRIFDHPPEP
jgi:hypothetical protein